MVNSSPVHSARRVKPIAARPKKSMPATSIRISAGDAAKWGKRASAVDGSRPSGSRSEMSARMIASTKATAKSAPKSTWALTTGRRRGRAGTSAEAAKSAEPSTDAVSAAQAAKRSEFCTRWPEAIGTTNLVTERNASAASRSRSLVLRLWLKRP